MHDELIKQLRETSIDFGESDHVSVMMIEAADAIEELQKRKHGKWVEHGEPNEYGKYEVWYYACSFCGQVGLTLYNYCPNCGARIE